MILTEHTLSSLREEFAGRGIEPFRANQVLKWVYKKLETDFVRMTDLPKDLREDLARIYKIHTLTLFEEVQAPDATKFLFKTHDGHVVETVLIRERDHLTLCVSSQVGCAVGCTFCATALDGLIRNLTTSEIIDQFLQVQLRSEERIRNVVFMGMGEPLANYENLRRAVEIMISPWGLDLSKRRVTISTSGLISQIKKMAGDPVMRDLNLAVSLNSPRQDVREEIMPLTKTNRLSDLMDTLIKYPLPRYRRITLEYVLIKDVNDSEQDARHLAEMIRRYRKRFKVNLIPFNPSPDLPYERPSLDRVMGFQKILWDNGISTFVRFSKGYDAFGACGQLRAKRVMLKSHINDEST